MTANKYRNEIVVNLGESITHTVKLSLDHMIRIEESISDSCIADAVQKAQESRLPLKDIMMIFSIVLPIKENEIQQHVMDMGVIKANLTCLIILMAMLADNRDKPNEGDDSPDEGKP